MGYINKVKVGSETHLIEPTLYVTAATTDSGGTYTTSTLTGFELTDGATVQVKFPSTNKAGATLSVNSTTAKAIYYNGAAVAAKALKANHIYNLTYDGTQWQVVGDLDTDTNTHRPIQVNGTEVLGNNTTALNLKNGDNISITNSSGTVTISAVDKYHKSGSWSGLTYTATAVNDADELKFTIPTGTSGTTVAVGNHNHDDVYAPIVEGGYLPLSGGTMNGTIAFEKVTSTSYPANSYGLSWSGDNDGASIYYSQRAANSGHLVLQTADDNNENIIFRHAKKSDANNYDGVIISPYYARVYPAVNAQGSIGTDGYRWANGYYSAHLYIGPTTFSTYNSDETGTYIEPGGIGISNKVAQRGYYLRGGTAQYARLYVHTIGTASTAESSSGADDGTQGTLGNTVLELGNATARGAKNTTNGAHNARGLIKIYGPNTGYTQIVSNLDKTSSYNFWLPNYAGEQYAVHVGSASAVGSTTRPVYIAANGRATQTTYAMAGTNTTATTAITYSNDLDTGIWYVNGITGADKTKLYNQADGVIIANKYSNSWITEIFQDYRTGRLAVRGKTTNGWTDWTRILDENGGTITGDLELISGNTAITNAANKRVQWRTSGTSSEVTGYITISSPDSGRAKLGIHATGDLHFRPGDSNNALSTDTGTVMTNTSFYPNSTAELMSLGISTRPWNGIYSKGGTFTGAVTVSTGGIWVQGGSEAGSDNTRMALTSGMPDKLAYNSKKRGVFIYSNAIALADPINGNSNNDAGWIRHLETTSNSGTLEIAVGDDNANEQIVVRRYNASNTVAKEIKLIDTTGNSNFGVDLTVEKSVPIIKAIGTGQSSSRLVLERHNNDGSTISSWQLVNSSGTLALQNNWTGNTYFSVVTYAHTSGDITINKGDLILSKDPTAAMHATTKQYVDGILAANNAMTFKGTLGTGGTITTLPDTHEAGDTYRVIKAGTYAGKYCEVGTLIICINDGTAAADADWTSVETNEDGAVIGPTSSTTNSLAFFNSTSGRVLDDTGTYVKYLNHAAANAGMNKAGYIDGIHITGAAYGEAANLISNTAGLMSYGDAGPQIRFTCSNQNGAIIFNHYDNTTPNSTFASSFNFVTDQANGVALKANAFVVHGANTYLSNNTLAFAQGGGWAMSDSTWIRTVGSKSVYMNAGTFRNDGTTQLRTLHHVNPNIAVDGQWTTGATGTANSGEDNATRGTLGTSILVIGNTTARPAAGTAGGANNAKGYLRICGEGTGYGELAYNDSMFTSNKSIYLTNTTNSGISNEIRGITATNDFWRVAGGATASNAGYMEIATGDDNNEPIYVRQYTGTFVTVKRTATLLDASGHTEFPVQVTAPKFIGALEGNADSATNISSKTPTLAASIESNEIKVIDLGNNAPEAGLAQRHAIDFKWYSSHWAIGNLRSGSTPSAGFGFSYCADGTTYSNVAIISNDGEISAIKGFKGDYFTIPRDSNAQTGKGIDFVTGTTKYGHIGMNTGNMLGIYGAGSIAIRPSLTATNCGMKIEASAITPGATNQIDLGASNNVWKNVYATTFTGSLSGNAATASKVSATLDQTHKIFLLGTQTTITSTAANVSLTGDTGVYLTTTAGELSAYRYSWHYGANEKAYTYYNTSDDSIDFVFVA